jgi:hypothetical protein
VYERSSQIQVTEIRSFYVLKRGAPVQEKRNEAWIATFRTIVANSSSDLGEPEMASRYEF